MLTRRVSRQHCVRSGHVVSRLGSGARLSSALAMPRPSRWLLAKAAVVRESITTWRGRQAEVGEPLPTARGSSWPRLEEGEEKEKKEEGRQRRKRRGKGRVGDVEKGEGEMNERKDARGLNYGGEGEENF